MSEIQQTLLEKYFPQSFDDVFLPKKIKDEILAGLTASSFRLLLHSSPGTGKTTCARLLGKDFETLYLSGSNSFSIETIRQKVMPFATGFSVMSKRKLIIIDECENLRDELQDNFKVIFDQCKSVSFCFITNEINKVNDAVKSRCNRICFDFSGDEMQEQLKNFVKFMKTICESENISFEAEGLKKLYKLLFPDFRQLLVTLQKFKDNKTKITEQSVLDLNKTGRELTKLYEIIEQPEIQGKSMYEKLSEFKGKEKECFQSLGEPFFEHLNSQDKYDTTLKVALIVSKYSNMFVISINKFTTLLACIVELKTCFR